MRHYILIAASFGLAAACTDSEMGPTAPDPAPLRTTSLAAPQSAAAAVTTRTEFQGFICFGTSAGGYEWTTNGGVWHFRNGQNVNRWVTGNPLIDGVEHNVADMNLNLKNGTGTIHLDVSVKPDAVNGTWEIRQTVQFRGFEPVSTKGVGHGTGDLQGMTLKFIAQGAAPIPEACGPGGGFGPAIQGVITSP